MEWLEAILKSAKVTDGVLDVGAAVDAIKKEIPNHFVAKTDYNAKTKELQTANETIKTLKKDNQDNEALQSTIKEHETLISNLQKENADIKKQYALEAALSEAGCSDPGYLIYKHGGLEKFTFDKEGKPVDAQQVAKTYKETLPHIFPTGQKKQMYSPDGGTGGDGSVNPFAKETWNLTKQGQMLRDNPAEAKELAAAVGVTI